MKPLLVSLAWGPDWQQKADRLKLSAEVRGFDIEIVRPPGRPVSRQHAWTLRPGLMRLAVEGNRPVLFLDADAQLRGRLAHLDIDPNEYEFAAVRHSPEFWRLGVLWIAPTKKARAVLARFGEELDRAYGSFDNDEPIFAKVAAELGARVKDLPPEYNWCEAWNDRANRGNRLPVIEVNA